MALNAFTRDVEISEGRIQPVGWTPQDAGAWVFCLGQDVPGVTEVVAVGDSVTVSQSRDWTFGGSANILTASIRLRPPSTIPLGVWWRASLLVDGVEVIGKTLPPAYPGQPAGTLDYHDFGCSLAPLAGSHVLAFKLALLGTAGEYELEIPAFYVDAIVTTAEASPFLINDDPEDHATQVLVDQSVQFDLVDTTGGSGVDLANTTVTINGETAYAAGGFTPRFSGPASATSHPQTGVTRFVIDPLALLSGNLDNGVTVQTQLISDPSSTLDLAYSFTAEHLDGPAINECLPTDQQTIRISLIAPVGNPAPLTLGDGTGSTIGDALDPSHYTITMLPGDGETTFPLVSVTLTVVSVTLVSVDSQNGTTLDLHTDIEMTPGSFNYVVSVQGVRDIYGNQQTTTSIMSGWQPPVPAGRAFDLYEMLPEKNRAEDDSGDLQKFCAVLQEVFNLQLYDVDRFAQLADPSLAPAPSVDAMLDDMGNPFDFDLDLPSKRRLVTLLMAIYRQKGTDAGTINVARLFLGLTVSIRPVDGGDGWILGRSRLDTDARLGSGDPYLRNSFDVVVTTTLTADQLAQLTAIAEYMKPAWTHLRQVVQPAAPPPPYNPVVLGISRLDVDWRLH